LRGWDQTSTGDPKSPERSAVERRAERLGRGSAAGTSSSPIEAQSDQHIRLTFRSSLRYGENPHQPAALYATEDAPPHSLVNAQQLHGKELSYNNLLDLNAALAIARSLPQPAVAVLKHNNPCGAATASTLGQAVARAFDGDPLSAFGSVLGVNVPVDAAMAEFLAEPGKFVEAIVAPDFTPEATEILTTKPKWRDNVRLLKTGSIDSAGGAPEWRQIDGGMLCQTADNLPDAPAEWKVVTEPQPNEALRRDLEFAWAVCRHVKSNAIVLVREGALVGVGAGQMSRVDSVEIALKKAGDRARGAVLASDAFFPFDDSIGPAAAAGVVAVIQPGGSRRDEEVIAACNRHGLPMIFTGRRHFRH
jgi:phosphoribosylaminoimidazolecarboxamide formyltransferase/IMP cyclohydrolase